MGLDYGSRTVGVAVSDLLGLSAQPVETVFRKKENHLRQTLARLHEMIRKYEVTMIVVGYPIHLDGESASGLSLRRICRKAQGTYRSAGYPVG